MNRAVAAAAAAMLGAGAWMLAVSYGWRHGALLPLGGLLGLALYHAAFGFTAAWRALIVHGRGEALRAQLAMLALASALFLPALISGSLFGRPVTGAVAPAGVSVAVGAFLFGIGMQLGGGCASGTLFGLGGGSVRLLVTLAFFIAGSLLGTLHAPWWYAQPSLGSVSLIDALGAGPALAVQFGAFAVLWLGSVAWQRRRSPVALSDDPSPPGARLLRGPWPVLWGAVALALLNWATLALAGHPWSITFAFSLWGAKIAQALGVGVAGWEFWTWPFPARALARGVAADGTSVMDAGIVLGAALAAALAGRFRPVWGMPWRALLASVIGGLLLGYGARLAFGCNIGALFSGIASFSLHGWLWLATGLAGNWAGVRLRRSFGLSNG